MNSKQTINLSTAGGNGTYNFSISLKDAVSNASTALGVSIVKDTTAPVATGETVSTTHNTPLNAINVLSNDSDTLGTVLLGAVSNQVGGTFTVSAGKIDFTPTNGFSGAASCTYQVLDPAGNISTATLTVNVAAANVAPTANDFTFGTSIGNAAKTFSWLILSGAADADGDSLSASVQADGTKGTFSVS